MSTPSELVPVPAVAFDKVRTYAVPHDGDDVIVLCFQPRAAEGFVLANAWHEGRTGIITVVLRRACERAAADASASAYYDL